MESTPARAPVRSYYPAYYLAVCCVMFFLSNADRLLFGVLISPIKAEFNLSDTQLGALSGLAFGLFYTLCGLPLAYLADRTSRKWLLAASVALWSLMTMACGLARSAWMLTLARFGVGIGEGGGAPAAISALSDLFPKERRATALAFFGAAGSFGGALVFTIGAWLATRYGWREAFIILGAPGLLLTLIIAFTVREPQRGAVDGVSGDQPTPSLTETLTYMVKRPVIFLIYLGGAASSAAVSLMQWLPAFLQRSHGLSLMEAGGALGGALMVAGPLGQFVGGQLSDRAGRHGTAGVMRVLVYFTLATGVAGLFMVLAGQMGAVFVAAVLWKVTATAFPPPVWALSQSLVEVRMRATSMAVVSILQNLFGYGCGPALVGLFSEIYRPAAGEESLRWAMVTVITFLSLLGAALYFAAYRSATRTAAQSSAT